MGGGSFLVPLLHILELPLDFGEDFVRRTVVLLGLAAPLERLDRVQVSALQLATKPLEGLHVRPE